MKYSITTYVTKPPSAVEIRTLVPLEGMEEQCHNVIAPEFAQGGGPRGQTTNQILAQERALRVLLRDGHRRSQTLKCSNVRRGGENRGNASRCLNVIA